MPGGASNSWREVAPETIEALSESSGEALVWEDQSGMVNTEGSSGSPRSSSGGAWGQVSSPGGAPRLAGATRRAGVGCCRLAGRSSSRGAVSDMGEAMGAARAVGGENPGGAGAGWLGGQP